MIIGLLNKKFVLIKIIDDYISFIWTERYRQAGDFELYLDMTQENFDNYKINRYISNSESDKLMIIESVEITSDIESGNKFKVTGRSLESILSRRIVWEQTSFKGKLHEGIYKLINEAFLNPKDTTRKLSLLTYKQTENTEITSKDLDVQYTGDNIYDIINEITDHFDIGYKITFTKNETFEFTLYKGTDRSKENSKRTPVVFAPYFNNIINSDYLESVEEMKNVARIAGEEKDNKRKYEIVYRNDVEVSGINRRELFVDARDLSQEESTEDGQTSKVLSDKEYSEKLKSRGKEQLTEYKKSMTFDGEVDVEGQFKFNEDFFLGDIVQFMDEYGNDKKVRVDEFIMSDDNSSTKSYPSFSVLEDPEEKEGDE